MLGTFEWYRCCTSAGVLPPRNCAQWFFFLTPLEPNFSSKPGINSTTQGHRNKAHHAGSCAARLPRDGNPRKRVLLDAESQRRGEVPGPGASAHSACPTYSSSRWPAMCQHGCVAERTSRGCSTHTAAIDPVRSGGRSFGRDSRQVVRACTRPDTPDHT